ncbi:MAG TPA: hypothetical protein VI316_08375, partial [Candidatus Dormibacteraeota bacterium]
VPLLAVLDDPDLWWHLRVGQWILDHHAVPRTELFSYTAAGNPVTYHEWGSEVLFAVLNGAGGLLLLSLVTCVLAWSGLVALAMRAHDRGAPLPAIAVSILLGAKVLQTVAGPRPQMLGFALTCWVLLVAERHLLRGGRLVWLLPALLLVWANVHGGFIYGIALLAALTGLEAMRLRLGLPGAASPARVRTLGLATLAASAAACINPFGPGLYAYALTAGQTVSHRPIAEWQSPNFHDASSWALLALIVAWALLAGVSRGPGLRDAVLGTAGIAAALLAIRNSELAVALAVPGVALMLGRAWASLEALHRAPRVRLRPPVVAAVATAAAVAVVVGIGRVAGDSATAAEAATYPACSARVLAAVPGDVRVHAAYADSGYLILKGWPHLHVYNYGESVSLGDQVLASDLRISSGTDQAPSALTLLDQSGTNAVLTDQGAPLDARLAQAAGWRMVAVDHGRTLWLRGPGAGAAPASVAC